MDKKYAIFDMDGTLIDSMIFWENLAFEYLKSKKIEKITQDILEIIKPMTVCESADLFKQKFGFSGNIEEEMNTMMYEHYKNDIPLKSGVRNYLKFLKNKGVRMCVASSTTEYLMKSCLSRLGILEYFEFLISCETVGVGKSSPVIYHESARKFNATTKEIVIYEDALYAIRTAKDAGYYVVAVYDDSNSKDWNIIEKIADKIILNWEKME